QALLRATLRRCKGLDRGAPRLQGRLGGAGRHAEGRLLDVGTEAPPRPADGQRSRTVEPRAAGSFDARSRAKYPAQGTREAGADRPKPPKGCRPARSLHRPSAARSSPAALAHTIGWDHMTLVRAALLAIAAFGVLRPAAGARAAGPATAEWAYTEGAAGGGR